MFRNDRYEWEARRHAMRFVLRSRQNIPTDEKNRAGRKAAKNEIRSQFHRQLKNLWHWTPYLRAQLDAGLPLGEMATRRIKIEGAPTFYGAELQGIVFYPLVTYGCPWVCEHLDIRFLIRQDRLDTLDTSVGDIDARLSVVFDALRIPQNKDQLIEDRESLPTPCFCLLEDDGVIQRLNAETLHLLNEPDDNSSRGMDPDKDQVTHVTVTLRRREKEFSLFGA